MKISNRNNTLKELRWNRKAFLNLKNIPFENWVWNYMVRPKNRKF